MPIIDIKNLGKKYILRHSQVAKYHTLRESIYSGFKLAKYKLLGRGSAFSSKEEFWALRNISFELKQGEKLGIIGRNGAGKSTLLKLLSRITVPTEGRIRLNGRVASLLEVGTGFHPELTGRENIFLNGAVMGMKRAEIKRKFDEIVDFAVVEKFLDTPVKRYSSGMYVRLAFAVAAHLESEILLIDEILAVGDIEFQKKCLAKMNDVSKEGRTILFVSHNMQTISSLTERCLVLEEGKCVYDGDTPNAINEYFKYSKYSQLIYTAEPSKTKPIITKVRVVTSEPNNIQYHGQAMEVRIELSAPAPLENASLAFDMIDSLKQRIGYFWRFDSEKPMCREKGVFEFCCLIPKVRLYIGHYTLIVHFSERFGKKNIARIEEICPFEVVMYNRHHDFGWRPNLCTYIEDCEWTITKKE